MYSVHYRRSSGPGAPRRPHRQRRNGRPRAPWGEPDLQGTFSNRTITPFERPSNLGGREFFTGEEVAALEKGAQDLRVEISDLAKAQVRAAVLISI